MILILAASWPFDEINYQLTYSSGLDAYAIKAIILPCLSQHFAMKQSSQSDQSVAYASMSRFSILTHIAYQT